MYSTRTSSFINNIKQLVIVCGQSDSDRGIAEMNFSLVREVEIAGVQIWKAIEDINNVYIEKNNKSIVIDYIFTSIYQAAQGVERLFKITIELIIYKNGNTNKENTDKLLHSHKHNALYSFIKENTEMKLDTNGLRALNMLEKFYSKARYNRFKYSNDNQIELQLLNEFGAELEEENYNEAIKHMYGKALKQISRNIFEVISTLSRELNIYVYELNSQSVAQFVFYDYDGDDLYEHLKRIELAKMEFLLYLIKNGENMSSIKNIKEIDFDDYSVYNFMKEIIANENSGYEIYNLVNSEYDEMVAENKEKWKNRINILNMLLENI